MEQEPQEAPEQEAPEGGDPIQALGQGLQVLVEGIQGSSLGDDVKKQAASVLDAFSQLASMIGGGGAQGPQPMSGSESMGGGNPNAQPVR